jgi:release factor glutamine methyltransferase
MGTGSGILALEAAKMSDEVIAVDKDPEAVQQLHELVKQDGLTNVHVLQSDLFQKVHGEFDVIIFNAPYLPEDGEPDMALDGGKFGYELAVKFLRQARGHLAKDGVILLLISTLTNPEMIEKTLRGLAYAYKVIDEEKLAFEKIYVYKITRTD